MLKALSVPLAILLAWSVCSGLGLLNDFFLPPPWRVVETAMALLRDGVLLPHIATSMGRVLVGFLITTAFAFPLGVLVGLVRAARDVLEPPLEFLRHVPPLALTPLLVLWCGIGETSKLAVIILATFFPIFLNTASGVAHCDNKLIEVGKIAGLGRMAIVLRIILPASLPSILTGLRLGLGFSWRALIGAELLAAAAGLGYMIIEAEQFARTDIVLVGILTIGTLGYAMDLAFRWLSMAVLPWQREFATHAGH
ncbi:MAG: ABC transporter permease [Desulfovibrionaceae bacterium]